MPIYINDDGFVDETPCAGCGWPVCSCLCAAHDDDEPAGPGEGVEAMAGLYRKYSVSKADGTTDPNAVYFVLRIDTDPAARRALMKYAECVWMLSPALADDLVALVKKYEPAPAGGEARRDASDNEIFGPAFAPRPAGGEARP